MENKKSKSRQKLRANRQALGLCIYCGKEPPKLGVKGCSFCQKKLYARTKKCKCSSPEKQKEYRDKVRLDVIQKYGGHCECCKEINPIFLTIDHINGDGANERRELYGSQSGSSYGWFMKLRREKVRDDLRVMCWNCNFAVYRLGACPHESKEKTNQGIF